MQYSTVATLFLLPALSLAAPAVEAGTPTNNAGTATAPSAIPSCYYSVAPSASATAYAAYMPNPSLTSAKISQYFQNFNFKCSGGQNFQARELGSTGSGPAIAGHWFGGIKFTAAQNPMCTPPTFATLVQYAMQDGNSNTYSIACNQWKQGQTGANAPFETAAANYFASVK